MLDGRKHIWQEIELQLAGENEDRIWFHVASLGEYEQARPVMEALKLRYPKVKIVCTFFSPSGYEVLKNDKASDYVFYLPFDNKGNALKLLKLIQPKMAFWVKYDLWYYYIQELHQKQVPTYLLSASFRQSQIYFRSYGVFFRSILQKINGIYTQNATTTELLLSIGVESIVSKDTRFDRVHSSVQQLDEIPAIADFKGSDVMIVAGSSYAIEEQILADFTKSNRVDCKIIIAPHFVDEKRISEIEKSFPNDSIRWSKYDLTLHQSKKILIIDCIGILSKIYRYADLAFIGGGFKHGGLHNILEAACFGVPTLFGPEIKKFPEAQDLVKLGGAFVVSDSNAFSEFATNLLQNKHLREKASRVASTFINENVGATEIVMKHVFGNE